MTNIDKESFSITAAQVWKTIQYTIHLFAQTPVGKRSKKANIKVMSPMPSQTSAPSEADKVSSQDIIPHIVLNLTREDYPSASELLKGSTLPPLVEVCLISLLVWELV